MSLLIVYAHPNTGGHCELILKETLKQLEQDNQDYELIDLYKIHYDPVLHDTEHFTRGKRFVSEQNKAFQEKILHSKSLLFIYPIWWSSMPAILKGFIDRVFTSPFAFQYIRGRPVGKLKGKRAAAIITTGGAKWITRILQLSRPQMLFNLDLMFFCGLKARTYQIGNARGKEEKRRAEIRKQVLRSLKFLKIYSSEPS